MKCQIERILNDKETEMLLPLFKHFKVPVTEEMQIGEIYCERTPHEYNVPVLIRSKCVGCVNHVKLSFGHYCVRQEVIVDSLNTSYANTEKDK